MNLPIYDVIVHPDSKDISGMDFNSWVTNPAHESSFIKFSKQNYSVDEEKRIVTGVMISANKLIYRNLPEPCYYRFTPATIEIIARKFMENGYTQNLNLQHEEVTDGAVLQSIFIASNSDERYPTIPQVFSDQQIEDGSLFASYYVKDDNLWARVKSGEFTGFSIEIWSDLMKVENTSKFQKQNKMNKPRKTLWQATKEALGIKDKALYSEATSVDGAVYYYDGELGVGTPIFTDSEMTMPLPAGNYQVTISDEAIKLITVDESGVIVEIDDFVEEETETIEEVQEAFTSLTVEYKDLKSKYETSISEVATLKAKVTELESLVEAGKFKAQPKAGEQSSGKTAREMFKNRKKQ